MRRVGLLLWLLPVFSPFWVACAQDDDPKPEVQPYDCTQVPDAPLEINELGALGETRPRGSHDLAFDAGGLMTGFDGASLVRVSRSLDDLRVLSTADFGGEGPEGMEYLPDGRLITGSPNFGVFTLWPSGAMEPMLPDLREIYGILLGPDGLIYAADNYRIYRIDPDTAAMEVLADSAASPDPERFMPRVLNFSLDYRKMYVGTYANHLFTIDLDENLDPVGDPQFWMDLPGFSSGVDALAVDVCGNLYVPSYPDELHRITPEGVLSLYHKWPEMDHFGHGARWGTGFDGWRTDALYMPQHYYDHSVVEVVTGVPGRVISPPVTPPPDPAAELSCRTAGPGSQTPPGPALLGPAGFFLLYGFRRWRRRRTRSYMMTQKEVQSLLFVAVGCLLLSGCASSGEEKTLTTAPRTATAATRTAPPADPGPGKDEPPVFGGSVDAPAVVSSGGADRDGDGIPDDADKCPDDPEDRDAFQDDDGCPDPDNDGDGISDMNDRCPNDPETFNGREDADGCPD